MYFESQIITLLYYLAEKIRRRGRKGNEHKLSASQYAGYYKITYLYLILSWCALFLFFCVILFFFSFLQIGYLKCPSQDLGHIPSNRQTQRPLFLPFRGSWAETSALATEEAQFSPYANISINSVSRKRALQLRDQWESCLR